MGDARQLQEAEPGRADGQHAHGEPSSGSERSAMWCSAPGKPTSVSSSSPLAGLVGTSWCAMWPASSSRASATGSPWKARKIIRNV